MLLRKAASKQIRIALVILLFPAILNYYAFNEYYILNALSGNVRPPILALLFLNLFGIFFLATTIWFLGLNFLEILSSAIYWLTRTRVPIELWMSKLHVSLKRASVAAFFGAILWFVWTIGYYFLGIGFQAISIPIGVLSHILAAVLYVPLFIRWYLIRRDDILDVNI